MTPTPTPRPRCNLCNWVLEDAACHYSIASVNGGARPIKCPKSTTPRPQTLTERRTDPARRAAYAALHDVQQLDESWPSRAWTIKALDAALSAYRSTTPAAQGTEDQQRDLHAPGGSFGRGVINPQALRSPEPERSEVTDEDISSMADIKNSTGGSAHHVALGSTPNNASGRNGIGVGSRSLPPVEPEPDRAGSDEIDALDKEACRLSMIASMRNINADEFVKFAEQAFEVIERLRTPPQPVTVTVTREDVRRALEFASCIIEGSFDGASVVRGDRSSLDVRVDAILSLITKPAVTP